MERRKREKKSTALSARAGLSAAVDGLFARVTAILDRARGNVVRSVNSEMLLAYWHIGREIVEALQGGSERAEYGSTLIETLAQQLTSRYGKGFSSTNLRYFRTFYQVYAERTPEIRHMACGESGDNPDAVEIRHTPRGVLDDLTLAVEHADRFTTAGDKPTIGLILCAEKNEAVARYSVLNESKRIFAAKYVKILPTEDELQRELLRERHLIETRRIVKEKC